MTLFRRMTLVVLGLALGVAFGGMPYLKKINAIEQRVQIKINDQVILADVARTEKARQIGLSNRLELNVNEGLLFVFDEPGKYGFWMKGMQFPIDIIWVKDDRIVGLKERIPAEPGVSDSDLKIYTPPEDIDKVIEVSSGRIRLFRAQIGDQVLIKSFLPNIK